MPDTMRLYDYLDLGSGRFPAGGSILHYNPWRDVTLEGNQDIWWGDLHNPDRVPADDDLSSYVYVHESLCTNDFESLVGRANIEEVLDLADGLEGVHEAHGGYGTWAIALRLDAEFPMCGLELLDSLDNYPVLSDERWSNLEFEAVQEGWEDFGREEFQRELEAHHGLMLEEVDIDHLDDILDCLWRQAEGGGNPLGWMDGPYPHFEVERAAGRIDREDLEEIPGAVCVRDDQECHCGLPGCVGE